MKGELRVGFRVANLRGNPRRAFFPVRTGPIRRLDVLTRMRRLQLRQVHTHHRRSLGQPVALVDMLSKSRLDRCGQFQRELFRSRDEVAQAAQLPRLRLSQISAQERGSGEHHRDAVLFHQLGDFFRLERIRVGQRLHAFDERIPERHGATEAVKKWKRREHHIVLFRIEHDGELRDVAEDVAMAERHAFRFARASAGEKQDRFRAVAHVRAISGCGREAPAAKRSCRSTRRGCSSSSAGALRRDGSRLSSRENPRAVSPWPAR